MDELRQDREVVLEAVQRDGEALAHAADELRQDREVVLEAVRQDARALRYAAAGLRSDAELQPGRARSNAIATRGTQAPVVAVTRLSRGSKTNIEIYAVLGLSGDTVWTAVLPEDATLCDLAGRVASAHGYSRVHLSLPRALAVSPLDASARVSDFV
mmetsp:Transcript_65150/g.180715  ORF Transcript_65150/g.180715 Transcript_65150/m.180715 type:complete len:157 (+) Transcript_65150:1-471(+)